MIKVMSLKLSEIARVRLQWMDSFRECGNAAKVCRHFSIPLRTFWRWRKRYDPWDLKSLESRSRRPRHSPKRTHILIERRVLSVKQAHLRWGKEKIAVYLKREGITLSGKTIWKILKRHARIVRYHTRKRKPPKPRVEWAQVRLPGDLLQMDTKYVSHHGRRLYQYTIIDVISRVRFADIYRYKDMQTTIRFLTAALPSFERSVQMIQTDNGGEFGRTVTTWLKNRKTKHVFSHKKRPTENAYVERSHRTDEEEFYSCANLGATFAELRERFNAYLTMYNTERPHWSLGGKTPAEVLASYSSSNPSSKPCHMS
ncbi:MAG: transposase [Candidatus Melainabacteria bacterium]|nr:transposase [Candidatus Melainabacteria bacterium]